MTGHGLYTMVYIDKTGRRYGVREKKHLKDSKQLEGVNYTRAKKRELQTEQSALTDDVAVCKHTIDWEGLKLPAKDPDWTKRGIREAICIRKAGPHAINRVRGTTIYRMCIPSYCSLQSYLVVAVRSTGDDV